MVDKLVAICVILGVSYDPQVLDSFSSECDKVDYLLSNILDFLGG